MITRGMATSYTHANIWTSSFGEVQNVPCEEGLKIMKSPRLSLCDSSRLGTDALEPRSLSMEGQQKTIEKIRTDSTTTLLHCRIPFFSSRNPIPSFVICPVFLTECLNAEVYYRAFDAMAVRRRPNAGSTGPHTILRPARGNYCAHVSHCSFRSSTNRANERVRFDNDEEQSQ